MMRLYQRKNRLTILCTSLKKTFSVKHPLFYGEERLGGLSIILLVAAIATDQAPMLVLAPHFTLACDLVALLHETVHLA
jgi:hypothetical protein